MKNEQLKDRLDDALSGIGENPWLLRQVLARAESEENIPVKKKISLGTVVIAALILVLMSVGIAAVSNWNVLDFLRGWEGNEAPYITTQVGQEAETENARLRVDSVSYDGTRVAFDLTLENKNPEIPMWCWVEKLTVNGEACEPGVVDVPDPGIDSDENLLRQVSYGFEDQWLPGWENPDAVAQRGEIIDLSLIHADGQENVHVEMRVKTYRPIRPVLLFDFDDERPFRPRLEQKIAEGYYVIPAEKDWEGNGDILQPDGHFCPEEDLDCCPEGWSIAVSGQPEEDLMGGMTEETLEISFDAKKTALMENVIYLEPQGKYEDENCTAVFDQAEISPLGLCMALRVNPKVEECRPARIAFLRDAEGNILKGSSYFPSGREEYYTGDDKREMIWKYEWRFLKQEDLPDTFSISVTLENGTEICLPVKKPDEPV